MSRDIELEHRITRVEEAVALIPEMAKQMDEMSKQLTKYEARWGTIVMIVTAFWAVGVAAVGWFKGIK